MTNRNSSIASWLASLVFGTYAGAWGYATVSAFLGGGLARWLWLMVVCTLLAMMQVMVLGTIDVLLLWMKKRRLPNGKAAWKGSILSMVFALAIGFAWPFSRFGPISLVVSVFAPMLIACATTRLWLGERCDH